MTRYRTALIGAGFISAAHIEAMRSAVRDAEIVAIVDRDAGLAEAQAKKWGIAQSFADIEALIAANVADVAHVLVPPDLHAPVARRLIEAGMHVLLEKPMATSTADCIALTELAAAKGVMLGINQNFVFHPAYRTAKRILLEERRLGPIRSLHVTFNVPLRQLGARQFGHWMFRAPVNILLEQAVHPLSQMLDLLGPADAVAAHAGVPLRLGADQIFHDRWTAEMRFGDVPGQLYLAVGQSFHAWRFTAICDDGLLICDMSAGRVVIQGRAQWPEFLDNLATGTVMAGQMVTQSLGGAFAYLGGLFKLTPRGDGFSVSMRESIAAFYKGLAAGSVPYDGGFGTSLVEICEIVGRSADAPAPMPVPVAKDSAPIANPDVVVLGASGFIGTHLVRRLVAAGRTVRAVSRNGGPAQPPFDSPMVEAMRGDVTQRQDVERALNGAKTVVNLAHGGGGANWDAIKRSMVDSALLVAECAAASGAERLIHVGSIAGLYLGDPGDIVTEETPPDPKSGERALYARGKAEADKALRAFAQEKNLPLVILRPGLVVGEGTAAVHGGLGFWNNEQHIIGWNGGRNPLPFVLVEDVADAILLAVDAPEAPGKSYNLVGDVRPCARDYVALLRNATGRPFTYHPQSVDWLHAAEIFKWAIKRATGTRADLPSRRDFLSRGLNAHFDCIGAKRDLGWAPVSDRGTFVARAIDIHRQPFERAETAGTPRGNEG